LNFTNWQRWWYRKNIKSLLIFWERLEIHFYIWWWKYY